MKAFKILFCIVFFIGGISEIQAQVLTKETMINCVDYRLEGDTLSLLSPGLFTFEIDSIEQRKISREIFHKVVPDTLRGVLLRELQARKLEQFTILLYFKPDGEVIKAIFQFDKMLETYIKEREVNEMYKKN